MNCLVNNADEWCDVYCIERKKKIDIKFVTIRLAFIQIERMC